MEVKISDRKIETLGVVVLWVETGWWLVSGHGCRRGEPIISAPTGLAQDSCGHENILKVSLQVFKELNIQMTKGGCHETVSRLPDICRFGGAFLQDNVKYKSYLFLSRNILQ